MDAAATHRSFAGLGFHQIHLHDTDAESGREQNDSLIAEIARDSALEILVSGGAMSEDRVERLIDAGVSQVILGQGHSDIDALGRLAESFPSQIIVRADLGDPLFNRRNGRRNSSADMVDLAGELSALPIGGLAVHGLSANGFPGAPLRFVEDLVEASAVPVLCRTEASNIGELSALEHLGIAATLLGSSLFSGQLDAQAVAHHFGS